MDKEEENRLAMESLEDLSIPSYFFQSIEKITNQYFLNAICSISSLGVTHKSNIKVSSICEHFYHLISKLKKNSEQLSEVIVFQDTLSLNSWQ